MFFDIIPLIRGIKINTKFFGFFNVVMSAVFITSMVFGIANADRGSHQVSRAGVGHVQKSVENTAAETKVAVALETVAVAKETSKEPELKSLNQLLMDARDKCTGIAEDLRQVKTMATVNTVVTGVGTVAGGVALYAGLTKKNLDKQAEELERKLENLSSMSDAEFVRFLKRLAEYQERLQEYKNTCAAKQNLEKQSKKMGNLRTGAMVANTATAIAGTVIAGNNESDARSIADRIMNCKKSVENLRNDMGQYRVSGRMDEYQKLDKIVTACSEMYSDDLEEIYSNSNVAKISSAVNIGTGVIGTVTSAVANSDSIRNDNTNSGKQKEKNLNTAANIFAGASTIASGVSTVFNAKTIKAINDNVEYATKCEEALK